MPEYTENYGLTLPLKTENYDLDHMTDSMEIIDTELKRVDDKAQEVEQDLAEHKLDYVEFSEDIQSRIDPIEEQVGEIKDDFESLENDYATFKDNTTLKVAKVEKELNDYKATMQQVNINQEPKQKVSGYGTVSLPKNAGNGQVSAILKGNTWTNRAGIGDTSPQTIENLDSAKTYLLIKTDGGTVNVDAVDTAVPAKITGKTSTVLTWASGKIALYELSTAEAALTEAQLGARYHYVSGTKSTVSASRLKSVGKNLFDNEKWNKGDNTGYLPNVYRHKFIKVEAGGYYLSQIQSGIRFLSKDENGKLLNGFLNNGTFNVTKNQIICIVARKDDSSTWVYSEYPSDIQLQLEKGITATPYEPYTESNAYVVAKDENGNIAELRSLENETKDEVSVSEGKLYKRVSDEIILQESDINNFVALTGGGYANTNIPFKSDMKLPNTNEPTGQVNVFGMDEVSGAATFTTDLIGKFGHRTDGRLRFYLPDTVTNLVQAKTYLTGLTLIYQLAEPEIIPIQVSGSLTSHPNGTVFIEPIVADAGVYTDKIEVLHQDLPIKALEKLSKVDFMTGVETELDIDGIVIAENKLSFTHPELQDGDIVFFEYEYDVESTIPETEIEYYDSRYTIKDSVTDKFYKWNVTVADGVPSIELVEV